jgi:hypothetical protein
MAAFRLIGRTLPMHCSFFTGAETEIDKIKDNRKTYREKEHRLLRSETNRDRLTHS